mgnify:CR=1 FL=1
MEEVSDEEGDDFGKDDSRGKESGVEEVSEEEGEEAEAKAQSGVEEVSDEEVNHLSLIFRFLGFQYFNQRRSFYITLW